MKVRQTFKSQPLIFFKKYCSPSDQNLAPKFIIRFLLNPDVAILEKLELKQHGKVPYQFRLKFSDKFHHKVFIWGSNAVFTVIFIQLSVKTKLALTNTNLTG